MNTRLEQLAALSQLKDQGRITDKEYEDLEREILEFAGVLPPREEKQPAEESSQQPMPDEAPSQGTVEEEREEKESGQWLALHDNVSPVYLGALVFTSAVLVLVATMGLLPWLVSIIGIVALLATMVRGGSWVAIGGGVALILVWAASLFGGFGSSEPDEPSTGAPISQTEPDPAPSGSLGVDLGELAELWNGVDEAPSITKGFVRNTESGDYDSFIYRFDDWGRLAGAYDPSDDFVYALLATGVFSQEATSQLYLHLCFVVHPYSQECIDRYFEDGLSGGSLADFDGVAHEAEWQIEDKTWRLSTEGNVLTIRVLGEEVS